MDVARYMPSKGGSILITTRLTECRIHGIWENIDKLEKEDATQLLLKASGHGGSDQNALTPIAQLVVYVLRQHALDLVHAGAYIKKGYCTLSEYVQSFQDEGDRLMRFRPEQQSSRHGSVYTTFEVSAKALASSDSHDSHLALRLLNLLAFLDREAVEEEVFIKAFDECHQFEHDYGYVWEESDIQSSQCFALSSTKTDPVSEHRSGSEKLDDSESLTGISCNWRGCYRTGERGKREHDLIKADRTIQPMQKDYQESTGARSARNTVSNTIQISTLSDCIQRPIIDQLSTVSDSEPFSTDAVDTLAPGNDVSDDGELNHLHIWHRDKVRSSGLVELRKTSRLRAACIRLAELSLVKLSNNTISMHPLVHGWARTRLGEVARQHAWEQALSILVLASYNMDWTPFLRTIVSHTRTCIRNLGRDKSQLPLSLNVARALFRLARCCHIDVSNEAALAILEALSFLPEMQPHTWSSKNSLVLRRKAECLGQLGRVEEMQSCVDQIVQSTSRWFELDSWEAYSCQMLLADAHCAAGNFRDAVDLLEPLYERILQSSVLHSSDRRDFLLALSRANSRLENHDRAVSLLAQGFRLALRESPHDPSMILCILRRLSEAYLALGEADKAVTLLTGTFRLEFEPCSKDHTWHWIMSTLARACLRLENNVQVTSILEDLEYRRILLDDEHFPADNMHQLAIIYLGLQKPSQAVPLLEEVIELHRSSLPPEAHGRMIVLAMAYLQMNEPSQAITLFEELVEVERLSLRRNYPARLSAMRMLAEVYLVDKPSQAVTLLAEVVERLSPHDPDQSNSRHSLARAYLILDEPMKAIILLEEVVRGLPGRSDIKTTLADAYLKIGKSNEAVTLLKEVVKCYPADGIRRLHVMYMLSDAYLQLNKPSEALALLEEAVKLPSDALKNSIESIRLLVGACHRLNKSSQAAALLEELIERFPADDSARLESVHMLAKSYLILGKPDQTVTLLEDLVKCYPADGIRRHHIMYMLSDAYLQLDKPSLAVALLKELINSLPADAPGKMVNSTALLADAYYQLDKPSQATKVLEELVERFSADDPARLQSVNMLAASYLKSDKPDQTVTLLEDLVKCIPSEPSEEFANSMELLAEAFWKLDRLNDEVSLLERVVAWDTSHLTEDSPGRLISLRRLARGYARLGTREKVQEAVSLLEEVMEKGKETLHTDPEDLRVTQERLTDAKEKLRQILEGQLLVDGTKSQGTSDVATDKSSGGTVYRHVRRFLKRCLPLIDLDDGNEQNNDKRPKLL
jgi:tetratricopeptide (TPR) repeat protein